MAITLGSNIASLRGHRQLSRTSEELGTVFQRLSSGQRINRASDDAAGLSIADSLNARSRIYNQGVRNLNDGLSLLSIADSAIENLTDIMIRLEELAEQSANGVYTNKQRRAIDDEAQALSKEFFRITKVTAFNGQKLLSGEFSTVNLQGGVGVNAVLSAGVGGAIGTGVFGGAISYTTETSQSSDVALGDLNADGILDLVTTGYTDANDGYATVRLGLGDGTFGTSVSYSVESQFSYALTLGDLNGDGILDLVTAGRDDNDDGRATIRLGRGDGSFGSAVSYLTEPTSSRAVSLGDLNGDGILDLVTSGYGGTINITVRLGLGDGTFGGTTTYSTIQSGLGMSLGDLNGDSILDIVTSGRTGTPDGYAFIMLGVGDGTFGTPTSYAGEGHTSWAVTLGDLNGDGALDLVTAGYADVFDGYATVRLGAGDGTFGVGTSYDTETNASYAVTLEDLNGDGFLDLITAGQGSGGDGYVTIRIGVGNGTFGGATSYLAESNLSPALKLGDLNGDGVLDLVTAGRADGTDGYATVRLSVTKCGVGSLLPFSLKTMADARQALPVFRRKHEQLAMQRGEIGAFQSRTAVAINVLQVSSENFKAAESRIRDADIAEESSRLVRLNILQQAAASVLAQANQQPALALQLLSG